VKRPQSMFERKEKEAAPNTKSLVKKISEGEGIL
jgi:hypothetical protein